ncbi:hypothetical protein [Thioclava sp. GXIMD4215]|uniref:hypothetical protein n=1 Tax=Thioclava sp. GXIMD4215 TaxID=3131928 RepID=UPI00324C44F6
MHQAEHFLHAHLTGKATVASVGVLYGLLIAADAATKQIDWPSVHAAIRANLGADDEAAWQRKLDRIKTAGWEMHAAVTARLTMPLTSE